MTTCGTFAVLGVASRIRRGSEGPELSGRIWKSFECPVDAIGATCQHVFGAWLPTAAAQFDAGRAPFEEYPENTPQQPVRLHIPVQQQPTGGETADQNRILRRSKAFGPREDCCEVARIGYTGR